MPCLAIECNRMTSEFNTTECNRMTSEFNTIECNRMMVEFNTIKKHIRKQSVQSESLRTGKKNRRARTTQINALILKTNSTDRETAALTCTSDWSVIASRAVEKKTRWTVRAVEKKTSWAVRAVENKTSWAVSSWQTSSAGRITSTKKDN